jgi:hypothetical protein
MSTKQTAVTGERNPARDAENKKALEYDKNYVDGYGDAPRKLYKEPSKAKQAREEENRRLRTEAFGRPTGEGNAARETTYWIQEEAPAGNYFDSVGFQLGTTEAEAIRRLKNWQRSWPTRTCRLIQRTDIVIKQ